jgi:threonylcarbamoyladenosine tRNA methylthiotransferase MtaB
LALQSGSDSVLFRMRRRYTTEEFSHAVAILRRFFPGCAITTDLIAGFPGETEEEHQQSLAFCKAIGFSRIHVFPYSKREGTLAAKMPSQLDRKTKERRARELIGLQEELSFNYARTLLGTTQEVLFENDRDGGAEGYTPTYMRVFAKGAKSGDIIKVKLVNYQDERFTGEIGG